MRATDTDQNSPVRQSTENHKAAEAIATIWLVFYVLAVGVAITSPFHRNRVSRPMSMDHN